MMNVPGGHHDSLMPSTSRCSPAREPSNRDSTWLDPWPHPNAANVSTASEKAIGRVILQSSVIGRQSSALL